MKNEIIGHLTKENLFGEKSDLIQVKSFTFPDRVYEIDPKNKTCTCKEFSSSKGKLPCKHLRLVLGLKNEDSFPISLLKSAVQKAVRRGDVSKALLSAKSWLHKSPNDFFRRLSIIIVEDTILHPDFAKVVELSYISARKSFELTKELETFALKIVEQLAKVEIRDCDFISYSHGLKSINIIPFIAFEDLGVEESEITRALMRRSKMGGMQGDLKMLALLTRIWANRFKEALITLDKLRSIYDEIETRDSYDDIPLELTVKDIILESADFHSMPMIPILRGKQYVIDLIETNYPNDVVTLDERLKDIIWRMRSGLCTKIDCTSGKALDWMEKPYNVFPNADRERYELIYKNLEPEIDKLSAWFINKNK